jgi:tetratricopeptide (TPR) repeat protein
VGVAIAALATSVALTTGLGLRRDFDNPQVASVMAHFGDFRPTRFIFRVDAPQRTYLEARAAVELLDGDAAAATRFYRHAERLPLRDPSQAPYHLNRKAVAAALEGARARARQLLDEALDANPELVEALVNRGALAAAEGELAPAEEDLRRAISLDPSLSPAWENLAFVLDGSGRESEAADARERARVAECTPPRGFPHGVGNGYLYDSGAGQRFMLQVGASGTLSLYRRARARDHPGA